MMETTAQITPTQIVISIQRGWEHFLLADRRAPAKREYVYASAWRPCTRQMVLEMTRPEAIPPFEPDILAKFRRGQDRERDLLSDLKRIGRDCEPSVSLFGEQFRFELHDHKGRIAIVGKVDAMLAINGQNYPLEVKAWHPNLVAKIERFEDLFNNHWTRAGAHQLLAYLYGSGNSRGFLLLDRSGLPLLISVELLPNLERMEDFLMRAEEAIDHQRAGTLPDYTQELSNCKRCPFFGSVCNPPTSAAGAQVLTDPELESMLERREELAESADEYDSLDKQVKTRLRGVEQGIVGHFVIEGKWGSSTTYDIPPELKTQYKRVDPKGRFTLKITKL